MATPKASRPWGRYGGQTKRDRYQSLYASLKSERSSYEPQWRDLADYLSPYRVEFSTSDRGKGDRRNQKIIDSSAVFAANTLASGMHAGLTSPARPWMKLTTPDPELAKFGPVKRFLHEATSRMLAVLATTNTYETLPNVYLDLGVFGTSVMAVVEDDEALFRCFDFPIGSYCFAVNANRQVTTFMVEESMTVRQIVGKFGVMANGRDIDWSRISAHVRDQWDNGNYDTAVDVVWMVMPNPEASEARLGSEYLPFSSCHFEPASDHDGEDKGKFLRESGFRTNPIMGVRWSTKGSDAYGKGSPGWTAIGDIRQLQSMQRDKGKAIKKGVDPPLVGPVALRSQKTSLIPGDVTYVDQREGMAGLRAIHEISLNIEHLRGDINDVRYLIRRAFHEDLFLMFAQSDSVGGQPITAREVAERHEEKLLVLGPVLEKTKGELHDPLIDRVFDIMLTAELLPEIPQELKGVDLRVEYLSLMAQAQKLVGVGSVERFATTMLALVPVIPEVRHKVDWFQLVDTIGDHLGIDPRLIIETDKAKESLDEERQQQAAAEEARVAKEAAQAGKLASETQLEGGGSALDRMMQVAGGVQ